MPNLNLIETFPYLKVGDTALNDALLLESLAYRILSFYNSNTRFPVLFNEKEGNSPHSNFFDLKRIIEDVTHNTKIGQSLDMATEKESGVLGYTEERYNSIVAFKTSFYTIYLPVVMGIMLAGGDSKNANQNANQTQESSKIEKIALEIGHFFQVQDDYLDCYGNEAITGKIGTDIQDSKCSWLFVKAMEFGSETQKIEIVRNYGKNDAEMVGIVKKVYGEIGLEGIYSFFENVCEADRKFGHFRGFWCNFFEKSTFWLKTLPENVKKMIKLRQSDTNFGTCCMRIIRGLHVKSWM